MARYDNHEICPKTFEETMAYTHNLDGLVKRVSTLVGTTVTLGEIAHAHVDSKAPLWMALSEPKYLSDASELRQLMDIYADFAEENYRF